MIKASSSLSAATRRSASRAMSSFSIDYDSYFTEVSKRRQPSAIRALQPFVSTPGMISLGGGMPNSKLFPFKKIDITLDDGTVQSIEGADLNQALQYVLILVDLWDLSPRLCVCHGYHIEGSYRVVNWRANSVFFYRILQYTISLASHVSIMLIKQFFQPPKYRYSPTQGIPELVNRVTNMLTIEHELCEERKKNFKVAIVPGSQDGLAKIFDMLLEDNTDKSSLLVESPTYVLYCISLRLCHDHHVSIKWCIGEPRSSSVVSYNTTVMQIIITLISTVLQIIITLISTLFS